MILPLPFMSEGLIIEYLYVQAMELSEIAITTPLVYPKIKGTYLYLVTWDLSNQTS